MRKSIEQTHPRGWQVLQATLGPRVLWHQPAGAAVLLQGWPHCWSRVLGVLDSSSEASWSLFCVSAATGWLMVDTSLTTLMPVTFHAFLKCALHMFGRKLCMWISWCLFVAWYRTPMPGAPQAAPLRSPATGLQQIPGSPEELSSFGIDWTCRLGNMAAAADTWIPVGWELREQEHNWKTQVQQKRGRIHRWSNLNQSRYADFALNPVHRSQHFLKFPFFQGFSSLPSFRARALLAPWPVDSGWPLHRWRSAPCSGFCAPCVGAACPTACYTRCGGIWCCASAKKSFERIPRIEASKILQACKEELP